MNPIIGALMMERTPQAMQARVFGLSTAVAWAGIPLGGVLGGVAVQAFGLTPAIALAGCLYFVVALTPVLGFPLTTAAFIAAFMALAGGRSRVGLGASAVVGTVGLIYVFVKIVYLPLPKGDGPFETLTIALYRALRVF